MFAKRSSAIRRVRSTPGSAFALKPGAPRSTTASPPPAVPTTIRSACAPNGTIDFTPVSVAPPGSAHSSGCQRPSPSASATEPSSSPLASLGSQVFFCASLPP